jgi:hypothetical protein
MLNDIPGEQSHSQRIAGQETTVPVFTSTRWSAARVGPSVSTLNRALRREENGRAFAFPPLTIGLTDHRIEKPQVPPPIQRDTDEPLVHAIVDRNHRVDALGAQSSRRGDAVTFKPFCRKRLEKGLVPNACWLRVR